MSRIQLHIDRLVLPEMDVADRNALIERLRAELTRTLSDAATRTSTSWARSHRTPVLKLGRMPLDPGPSGGRQFGAALGRSVGNGLKP
jgi:hypothetical protein